jgi:hypothetical protein
VQSNPSNKLDACNSAADRHIDAMASVVQSTSRRRLDIEIRSIDDPLWRDARRADACDSVAAFGAAR